MKILFIIVISLFCVQSYADVFVYSEKSTKNVIFITESAGLVVISDTDVDKIEETILPHDIEFYNLTEDYNDYKLKNKKFVLNTQKISDKDAEKVQHEADKLAKDNDFASAKTKLIGLGLSPEEVESLR